MFEGFFVDLKRCRESFHHFQLNVYMNHFFIFRVFIIQSYLFQNFWRTLTEHICSSIRSHFLLEWLRNEYRLLHSVFLKWISALVWNRLSEFWNENYLQSAILLTFNLVAIMVIYPAFIAVDLRRRRAGRRDMGCCCMGSASEKKKVSQEIWRCCFLWESNHATTCVCVCLWM